MVSDFKKLILIPPLFSEDEENFRALFVGWINLLLLKVTFAKL